LLRQPVLNPALRAGLRPFVGALPIERLMRVPVVATVRTRLPSGAMMLMHSDGRDHVAAALYWRGLQGWEPETFAVLTKLLGSVETFYDVGASSGVFSLFASLERRSRRVFAFEPAPEMFSALTVNVALNNLKNVTRVEGAACDHDGTVDLNIPPGESLPFGASTLASFRDAGTRVRVPALRLDSFTRQHGINRVDLIKLDTEGTEPAALAGARAILERDQPWILCEVLHGLTEAGLQLELDRLGYRYFVITRQGLVRQERIVGDPTYRDRNWLFATPRSLEAHPIA
jgi:FkbM family methyltransferase